jgi:hypothetical protein
MKQLGRNGSRRNTSDSSERKERDASETDTLVPRRFENFGEQESLREDDQSH